MSVMTTTLRADGLQDLEQVASQLLKIGVDVPVWLFQGQMGAGKTTLIKELCRQLGVKSTVHSPTFGLVNEYICPDNRLVYHFDFYRIKNEVEAMDIGIEEYFDSGYYCFVEWPGKIENLWPLHYLLVELSLEEDESRTIVVREITD